MHHSKELAFTLILMLILSRCTVSFNKYSTLYMIHSFSCYKIIILFESESFSPAFLKTHDKTALYLYFFVSYNVH